jgi:hypothetical protein
VHVSQPSRDCINNRSVTAQNVTKNNRGKGVTYVFVLCCLHADTSTAHKVQTDFPQSAQNTRKGSEGWDGQVPQGGGGGQAAEAGV